MAIFGVGVGFKNCFGSTDKVETFLFSMFSLILTLDFDLRSFFCLFWARIGYFWGGGGDGVWVVVFLMITLSQPNYRYGRFVVGVVVVVGL